MEVNRRAFLSRVGLTVVAGGAVASCDDPGEHGIAARVRAHAADRAWASVRREFFLSPGLIHMSAMLMTSHPRPVRTAIDRYRQALDADPVTYIEENNRALQEASRTAAGGYLGIDAAAVALTDSTTMGVGLVYNGLRLLPGQEILTTDQDHYVTHESARLAALRTGATVRRIPLYDDIASASEEAIVARLAGAVGPATRVLALTWVHSSTGLKLPLERIAERVREINEARDESDRVLLCVDGVHGFGIEDKGMLQLGCDFFMAGCHKWLFGPRGTGIIAAGARGWQDVLPTIPSFIDAGAWSTWLSGEAAERSTTGAAMTPGGFKSFEHLWALATAFAFHERIGRARIAERTHELAAHLKEGLAGLPGVRLHTPRASALSSGIVAFDIDGLTPPAVVSRLRERGIIASVAPYMPPHVRLTPSIRNTHAEIDAVLGELRAVV
jgi:selenocysteine lyase/cysteine desulfurase